jgi:hypothetical protein
VDDLALDANIVGGLDFGRALTGFPLAPCATKAGLSSRLEKSSADVEHGCPTAASAGGAKAGSCESLMEYPAATEPTLIGIRAGSVACAPRNVTTIADRPQGERASTLHP